MGVTLGFFIALFAEMYGIPLNWLAPVSFLVYLLQKRLECLFKRFS